MNHNYQDESNAWQLHHDLITVYGRFVVYHLQFACFMELMNSSESQEAITSCFYKKVVQAHINTTGAYLDIVKIYSKIQESRVISQN